ncbi:MAG: carbohydrate kinase, partial [Proteobacteria bacterium]
ISGLEEKGDTRALSVGGKGAAITVSRAGANPPWRHEIGKDA